MKRPFGTLFGWAWLKAMIQIMRAMIVIALVKRCDGLGQTIYPNFFDLMVFSLSYDGAYNGSGWANTPLTIHLAGQPLAGGWYAVLWWMKGDLEYNYSTHRPRWLCRCNTSNIPWTELASGSCSFMPTVHFARIFNAQYRTRSHA